VVEALWYKPEGRRIDTRLGKRGFIQSLTEMSTRRRKIMFLESRERPVSRADNFTAICERTV
jgi:hypothetical protein